MEFQENDGRLSRREMCETLLNRASFLDKQDQALLVQVLERGSTATEIAELTGESARNVQRKIKGLMERLANPEVVNVMRHYHEWESLTGRVALCLWVKKWTLRYTAKNLETTLHDVRQRQTAVRTLLKAMNAQKR